MKDKEFTQALSKQGSEELLLWKDYSVYLYDEAIARDYVGEFVNDLAELDLAKANYIFQDIIEKLQEGKGLPAEMLKGKKPKIKKVEQGDKLYELREYSTQLRKQIRIYFLIDSNNKKVVFLNACFKSDNKKQDRDIKVAISR
ncbi:MAG TPA: type II toxin-antitoxin system RelE/ParE family toxin, partial [Methanofastidiosum sp.]|nr:type II toxin-antitoxin system RelE/ParE family toxin [Methanofastidiosum sp.]